MKITSRRQWASTTLILGYVALVLLLDVLAGYGRTGPIRWSIFHWRLSNGVDVFKLVAWFVIPFLFSLPKMDWGYFGVARWRRTDLYILGGLALAGLIAVIAVPWFPPLRQAFPSLHDAPWVFKWAHFRHNVLWTFSWLIGWEFMHRYVLLRHLGTRAPKWGWLLIPVYESVYHMTWSSWAMPAAMFAFSMVVTPWALKRRNTLLPFTAHLMVELELALFQILI